MRLEDTRAEYYFYTGKVSDIVRQLGFVGIAIIWAFRVDVGEGMIVARGLIPAAVFILLGLTADFTQYAAGAIIWDRFNSAKERELAEKQLMHREDGGTFDPEADDFTAPQSINVTTKALFWTKSVLMLLAYISLISYLISRIWWR